MDKELPIVNSIGFCFYAIFVRYDESPRNSFLPHFFSGLKKLLSPTSALGFTTNIPLAGHILIYGPSVSSFSNMNISVFLFGCGTLPIHHEK